MGACGCFSSGPRGRPPKTVPGYQQQHSFPEPPEIFIRDTKDILTRISEAQSPVDVERSYATVNLKARISSEFDGETGSSRALLNNPLGGFKRTSSISADTQAPLRRSVSDRGYENGAAPTNQVWTESRKQLEIAIHAEKAKDHSDWDSDLQSERLRKRLAELNLEMKIMGGDGNCQFRAVSYGLYGTQDYHRSVRQRAVEYMRAHKEEYEKFLGEDVNTYLDSMEQNGTWGDELTLRATSDYFGMVINVVTSEQSNWFMRYTPSRLRILMECFLTYVAPVHYNAIRRQTVTTALRRTLARQTSSSMDHAMKRAFSAERALASTKLAPNIREALRTGYKLDAPTTAPSPVAPVLAAITDTQPDTPSSYREVQRRKTDKLMEPVAEGLEEGRSSAQSGLDTAGSLPSADHFHGSNAPAAVAKQHQAAPFVEETFTNPLALPNGVPISAFAADAQDRPGVQLPLQSGSTAATTLLANGHALQQPSLI